MKKCALLSLALLALLLSGAGSFKLHEGAVRSVTSNSITIADKGGFEQTLSVNTSTQVYISGKVLPVRRIRRNSLVEIAANSQDVCLRIVVREVPR
jgi:hypothetical protein